MVMLKQYKLHYPDFIFHLRSLLKLKNDYKFRYNTNVMPVTLAN